MTDSARPAPEVRSPQPDQHATYLADVEQDEAGIITSWTDSAREFFGWDSAEIVNRPAHLLIPARNRTRYRAQLAAFFAAEIPNSVLPQLTVVHRDGREFKVDVSLRVIVSERGRRVVSTVAITDAVARRGVEAFPPHDPRFRAILDQINEACSLVDLTGNYLFVNAAFCRMMACTREEALGETFTRILNCSPGQAADIRDRYTRVYQTGEPEQNEEFEQTLPDGSIALMEHSISLQRDDAGRPVGFLTIIRNRTERRRAEITAAQAREAAEAASRAKSEFLANMSHEIRTPMNGIIGMTDLMFDTPLTTYQHECLSTVRSSAQTLLTIINDILDFSKIESRKLEIESVPFSIADLLNDTLKPLAITADQKGVELVGNIDADLPPTVIGDPVRLRQVITNLAGNAVKFTATGHVAVSVGASARDGDLAQLRFSVADTGIGIPASKHRTIFEAFSQADGSTTRQFGGTGLGLAIASTLVQMMGGRISVESEPERGSTFSFSLAMGLPASVGAAPEPPPELADLDVLIADDNAISRNNLARQASRWRMRPTVVNGGQEALEAIDAARREGRSFALMVLDANMPDVDGYTVAEYLARQPGVCRATIMLLSSAGIYADASRSRSLGITAYVTKPVRHASLQDAICAAIRRAARPSPHETQRLRVPVFAAVNARRILLAEDNVVNQRVAVGLLTKRGHHVTVVSNGAEAVAAVAREPFDLVLMDVQMPVMGGVAATEAIRVSERGTDRHLRIIAMTADAMSGDRERCLQAGMDSYVSKPVSAEVLFATVESPPVSDRRASNLQREAAGG